MCAIGGFSAIVLGLAYLGGAITIPALKAGWAKAKAWWQQHA